MTFSCFASGLTVTQNFRAMANHNANRVAVKRQSLLAQIRARFSGLYASSRGAAGRT
jgi:hypothetical protein